MARDVRLKGLQRYTPEIAGRNYLAYIRQVTETLKEKDLHQFGAEISLNALGEFNAPFRDSPGDMAGCAALAKVLATTPFVTVGDDLPGEMEVCR